MIKIENNTFESKTDDIAMFAAEATTFAVGVWEMLQKHAQNPEKVYKDIFAFGKLGGKGLEEWAKTHKPGEVPEWAEDSN